MTLVARYGAKVFWLCLIAFTFVLATSSANEDISIKRAALAIGGPILLIFAIYFVIELGRLGRREGEDHKHPAVPVPIPLIVLASEHCHQQQWGRRAEVITPLQQGRPADEHGYIDHDGRGRRDGKRSCRVLVVIAEVGRHGHVRFCCKEAAEFRNFWRRLRRIERQPCTYGATLIN